jgi:predicted aldo/keto reductase-like oxidoreductase
MLVFGCGLLKYFLDLDLKYTYTKKPYVILIGAKNVNELEKDLKIIKKIKRINKREFNLLKEIGKKILKENKNKAWWLNGHIGVFLVKLIYERS